MHVWKRGPKSKVAATASISAFLGLFLRRTASAEPPPTWQLDEIKNFPPSINFMDISNNGIFDDLNASESNKYSNHKVTNRDQDSVSPVTNKFWIAYIYYDT